METQFSNPFTIRLKAALQPNQKPADLFKNFGGDKG